MTTFHELGSTWCFAFLGSRLLVVERGEGPRLPERRELEAMAVWKGSPPPPLSVRLPDALGRESRVWDLPEGFDPPPGTRLLGLRALAPSVPAELFAAAGAAVQKADWIRNHRFCSRCGSPTARHPSHEAMACSACGQLHFPRLAPAVIVLVERGREMLLARSPHFPPGVYSTLAGFVEPGESLEGAVHREVEEEVGVRVTDLRYFGSQPWPFPHSLMVGFVARWDSGDISLDDDEIEDARWFGPDDLPPVLPFPPSIARRLVDDFLARAGPT
jgi:NAD+ diphosphatase